MTREQQLKIDFAFYMALANNDIYPEHVKQDARNQAIAIGMQLEYYPMYPEVQQSEAAKAFMDDPKDLSGTKYIR